MKIIRPVAVTNAVLLSSTVPETDYAAWSNVATYNDGDRVILTSTHRVYESLINANTGQNPASSANWLDVGPTNKWAMFDALHGTKTSKTGGFSFQLAPGVASDSLALLAMSGATEVHVLVENGVGGAVLADRTISLKGGKVTASYSDYFFEKPVYRDSLVLTDLPLYKNAVITVTLNGGGTVACGVCVVGRSFTMGGTMYDAEVEVVSYSKKEPDDFGNITVVARPSTTRVTCRVQCHTRDFDEILRQASLYESTPVVWVGSGDYDYLTPYGFYKSFSMNLALPKVCYASLVIERLV